MAAWHYSMNSSVQTTPSWFVSMGEFCTRVVNTAVFQLTTCVRFPEECTDDFSCGRSVHNRARTRCLENRDSMALLAAIFTGRESKARELMTLPWININAQYANGNTPLILAIQGNNDYLVELLLQHPGLNVNLRGLDGYTALIRACQERADYVAMILSHPEVDINLATYYGTTALTYSIRSGNDQAVRLLLARPEIDVNYQSRHGENALIEAVTYRRYDIARTLASRQDIELDIVDERDRTPFVMVTQYGHLPLVQLMILFGCDPSAEDDCGHNALYYAVKRGNPKMVDEIIDALAKPLSLMRICRTVIRRQLRHNWGYGEKLKPVIDKFPKNVLPRTIKRFLAYDP